MTSQVDSLLAQVDSLRAQVEDLTARVEDLTTQVEDLTTQVEHSRGIEGTRLSDLSWAGQMVEEVEDLDGSSPYGVRWWEDGKMVLSLFTRFPSDVDPVSHPDYSTPNRPDNAA